MAHGRPLTDSCVDRQICKSTSISTSFPTEAFIKFTDEEGDFGHRTSRSVRNFHDRESACRKLLDLYLQFLGIFSR